MTEVSEREAVAVGWRWTFDGETWAFSALRPGKFRFGQPNVVEPVYSAETVAALEAERDEAKLRIAYLEEEIVRVRDLAVEHSTHSATANARTAALTGDKND